MAEKKNVQNLKWATAHLSRRLGAGARRRGRWGAGLGAGRWARRAGSRRGSRRWGARARCGRARTGAGREGTVWACADGRGARGRARQARRAAGAGAWGKRAGGRAWQERTAGRRGAREAHDVGARGAAWACLGAPGALVGPVWGSCSQFGF